MKAGNRRGSGPLSASLLVGLLPASSTSPPKLSIQVQHLAPHSRTFS